MGLAKFAWKQIKKEASKFKVKGVAKRAKQLGSRASMTGAGLYGTSKGLQEHYYEYPRKRRRSI